MAAEKTSPAVPAAPSLVAGVFWTGAIAIALVGIGMRCMENRWLKKRLPSLVMPIGMFWAVLSGRLVQLIFSRTKIGLVSVLLTWLALTALGTGPLPRLVTRSIESSVSSYNPDRDPPLDFHCGVRRWDVAGYWRSQAAGAGDRVVMAAELYHLGLTKELITTGQTTEGVSNSQPDPSEQTLAIWTRLKIPRESIRTIGGRNTFEEMQQLKQLWPELEGKRIGLLTSALHLPRAVRLAKSPGTRNDPDCRRVRTALDDWGLLNFIPQAGNFTELAAAQHEIMAAWISR